MTDSQQTVGTIFCWLNLGYGVKPIATRGGKFREAWIVANGGPPKRNDRFPLDVFKGRMARVEVRDVESAPPYSVVNEIVEWQTGMQTASTLAGAEGQRTTQHATPRAGGTPVPPAKAQPKAAPYTPTTAELEELLRKTRVVQ